jgi:hypothetical protein
MPLVTTFYVTLMNCDLNACNHIPYKCLQDCDYRKKKITNQPFHARIKVSIDYISYMVYSKLYYALLDFKKVVIFAFF